MKTENGKWKMENGKRHSGWIGNVLSVGMVVAVFSAMMLGCSEEASEPGRTPHPTGWTDTSSADFHGKYVEQRSDSGRAWQAAFDNCRSCHGPDNSSEMTGVSCFGCHDNFPHPVGWSGAMTENLHQTAIQEAYWDLSSCKMCHGSDYREQKLLNAQVTTCYDCHTGRSGPQSCNVCHGGTNNAPPPDLLGGMSSDLITVGAHQAHVTTGDGSVFKAVSCGQCHAGFAGFSSPGHIDTTTRGMAEVQFGALASDSGRASPVWDRNAGTCSSVYCHGSFDGGQNKTMVWTVASGAECGSCHTIPPPAPHPQIPTCSTCHSFTQDTHIDGIVTFR